MYEIIYRRAPRLIAGLPHGTRAIDAYDACCKDFGWKASKRWEFDKQQLLYAENATPEGYSVWMIVHANLCEKYDESITWYNIVKGDKIEEIWNGSHNELLFLDVSRRVTFVRERSDGKLVYKFLGVYELVGAEMREVYGKQRAVKIYQRVSRTYPIEEIIAPDDGGGADEEDEPFRNAVTDGSKIEVTVLETNEKTTMLINVKQLPFQAELIGKEVGDTFSLPMKNKIYRIDKILS